MNEADQLLLKIRRACAVIRRDSTGGIVQLVLDDADANKLMAFGPDAEESKSGGEDSPYREPPVF